MVKINFMKKAFSLLSLLLVFVGNGIMAQIPWSIHPVSPEKIAWDNYSTSYIGDIHTAEPFLVTAIPYNGMYSNQEDMNAPLDMSFEGSLFRFKSTLFDRARKLFTYDSSEVYFLAPGINKENARYYEYRVSLNANTVITPWSSIEAFSDVQLGMFGKPIGWLGGYKTSCGNYLVVELRRKGTDTSFSSAVVYWKETKPAINAIYTSKNLNDFFTSLKRSWDKSVQGGYPLSKTSFTLAENSIIIVFSADIYKKEALEYQLTKNETIIRNWGANDFDNNFIWLKELPPGKYRLAIRFSKQRQHISSYNFEVKPAWHQTTAFKIITGSMIAACLGFIALLLVLRNERRKVAMERAAKEKLHLELKSIYLQLNPHFIFNCLGSIQGLINKNDTVAANEYLSSFGSLLRDSLSGSNKDVDSLAGEIATLDRYLALEQLRFGFTYRLHTGEDIDLINTTIPYLLLQPLVENAVKHGVAGMQEKGAIVVNFTRQQNDMLVKIADNGKGFNTGGPGTGHGLRLTRDRIQLLNKIAPTKNIILTVVSGEEAGTVVVLLFKNWLA